MQLNKTMWAAIQDNFIVWDYDEPLFRTHKKDLIDEIQLKKQFDDSGWIDWNKVKIQKIIVRKA